MAGMSDEYARQAERRAELIQQYRADPDTHVYEAATDPILWIDTFAMTLDPRRERSVIPFVLWDYQRHIVDQLQECIATGEDVLIEKSRDMGISWLVLAVVMWHWLHVQEFSCLIGSRREAEVDARGNLDSHFERARFMLRHLPEDYKATQLFWYTEKQHAPYMLLRNPVLGGQIAGESTNPSFSRQGRYTCVWLDEMAVIEDRLQDAIWTATGDATPCRIVVSTPYGATNQFARLAAANR